MYLKLSIIFIVLLGFTAKKGFTQNGNDTILFINGTTVVSTITDTANGLTTYVHPKKPQKSKTVDSDRIFSVTNKGGERLVYKQDTLGNELTVEEMRYYIAGQKDARKAIKGRGGFWTNMAVSAGAGITGSFLTPIVPFAVAGLLGLPHVKIKEGSVSDPENKNHDAYLMGYDHEGKRKRKVKALIGGGIGLFVGLGTSFILKATGDEILK